MTGRVPCCVPFCRRGTRRWPDATEIICGPHWKLVPSRLKRFKAATERRLLQAIEERDVWSRVGDAEAVAQGGVTWETFDKFSAAADRVSKYGRMSNRAWVRCRAAAVERAGGLR